MPHTDDAVRTLHSRKKSKRPHNIRAEDSERAIAQRAVEGKAILLNVEAYPLTAEAGLPDLNLKGLLKGLNLQRGGTASCTVNMKRGNQRKSLTMPVLVLEIPPFKIGPRLLCTPKKVHSCNHPKFSFSSIWGFYT